MEVRLLVASAANAAETTEANRQLKLERSKRVNTNMNPRKLFAIGGLVASLVLIGFGAASLFVGFQGREEVRDTLRQENIVGPEDSTIPGQLVDTGSEARAQADIMREHQLARTGGLTYAEMGRFATPDGDPAGTNNADLAATDENGNPLPNEARNSWVTATALMTSLNTAYFAEQVGYFAILMGTALLLTGIGFAVLTVGTLYHFHLRSKQEKKEAAARTGEMAPAAG